MRAGYRERPCDPAGLRTCPPEERSAPSAIRLPRFVASVSNLEIEVLVLRQQLAIHERSLQSTFDHDPKAVPAFRSRRS